MDIKKSYDQLKARKLYKQMMDLFQGVFPDYYGGCFIDDDNNLNVLVVDGKQELADTLKTMGILIKTCKYTYSELSGIMDKVNNFMQTNPEHELFIDLLSVYLNEEYNEIIVETRDATPEFISMFKECISSSDSIKIQEPEGEGIIMETESVGCGSKITSAKPSNMSLSCRVKKGDKEGFLTVAHAIPSLEPGKNTVFLNNKPVAVCTQKINEGMVDAAFCEITDPDFVVTNEISGTDFILDTETTEAIVGEIINSEGYNTSSSGKVVSTKLSFMINKKCFHDMVKGNYEGIPGDSGSIIFIYNPEKDKCYTVGIQKGAFVGMGSAFYSKADAVLNALGVERY